MASGSFRIKPSGKYRDILDCELPEVTCHSFNSSGDVGVNTQQQAGKDDNGRICSDLWLGVRKMSKVASPSPEGASRQREGAASRAPSLGLSQGMPAHPADVCPAEPVSAGA